MYHKAFTIYKKSFKTNLYNVVRINKNLAKADDFHFRINWWVYDLKIDEDRIEI